MRLDFLRPLLRHPGPYASVYLTTARDAEDAAQAIALRWRAARGRLSAAGADENTLNAIEGVVTDPARAAPGRAVFAAGGQVAYTEGLPAPPRREHAVWSQLPDAAPLLAQRPEPVAHVRVLADRTGADITAVGPGRRERHYQDHGRAWPVQRVKEGGWSQERYQRSATETWKHNAKQIADTVAGAAAASAAELILIGGDVRARELLLGYLADEHRARAVVAGHGGTRGATDEDAWMAEVDRLLGAHRAARHRGRLAEFRAGHGRGDAVDGTAAVTAALRSSQARVLLAVRDGLYGPSGDRQPDSTRTAGPGAAGPGGMAGQLWYGPEPAQAGVAAGELRDLGVAEPRRERASSVLIRAAVGTAAELEVIDPGELPLRDGNGALLRFIAA